jgi:hypothetical protein
MCAPMAALALLVSCGSPAGPTASATSSVTITPTFTATATSTPNPGSTAAASAGEVAAVASLVYPACTPANCAGDAMFTTCDASSPGPDVFAPCPLSQRLAMQLHAEVDGVASAPDPVGGGQDPEWITRAVTTTPSATGGVDHVTLGFGPGTTTERYDLVVVVEGSRLLVDDIYCTGADPASADVFAGGWLDRCVCSA